MATKLMDANLDARAQILVRDIKSHASFLTTSISMDHTARRLRRLIQLEIKQAAEPSKSIRSRLDTVLDFFKNHYPMEYREAQEIEMSSEDIDQVWQELECLQRHQSRDYSATLDPRENLGHFHGGKRWELKRDSCLRVGTIQIKEQKVYTFCLEEANE